MHIKSLKTHDEFAQSFDAFLELRPHLRSKEIFVTQVMEQYKEGYEIIAANLALMSDKAVFTRCPARKSARH